jgi:ABC-type antimicrobial peptide transport system permease subunit
MISLKSQRTREIGIRMALGAQRRDVITLFLRQGGKLIAIGVIIRQNSFNFDFNNLGNGM